MNCAQHPKRKATSQCTDCGAFLCDACAVKEAAGTAVLCTRCVALRAAADMRHTEQERREQQQRLRKTQREKQEKQKRHRWGAAAAVIFAAILLNAVVFVKLRIPAGESLPSETEPMAAAVLVDSGIREYRRDHGGTPPPRLNALRGDYLPEEVLTPGVIDAIVYEPGSGGDYSLAIRREDPSGVPEMILNGKGVSP